MADVLKPSVALLVKLGSLIVHYEERDSDTGHAFDQHAIDTLREDPEVQEWLRDMDSMALLPKKR